MIDRPVGLTPNWTPFVGRLAAVDGEAGRAVADGERRRAQIGQRRLDDFDQIVDQPVAVLDEPLPVARRCRRT